MCGVAETALQVDVRPISKRPLRNMKFGLSFRLQVERIPLTALPAGGGRPEEA